MAKCCSASVSVGAISAPWRSCSTARSIAYSATTVLPEPTSPISRRCIGRSPARSASIASSARRWSPVSGNGSCSASQRAVSVGRPFSTGALACSVWARRRCSSANWTSRSSSKASRRRACSWSGVELGEVRGAQRRGPVGQPLAQAQGGGQRLEHLAEVMLVRLDQGQDLRRGEPVGGRVVGDGVAGAAVAWPAVVRACPCTRKRLRASNLPCSTSRVPAGYLLTSHGWLKNVAFIGPVSSATVASTRGRIPRRRTGRALIARTSTTTVALSPGCSWATARASRRSRGRCSSRSPTVCRPSVAAAFSSFGPSTSSGTCRRDGHG